MASISPSPATDEGGSGISPWIWLLLLLAAAAIVAFVVRARRVAAAAVQGWRDRLATSTSDVDRLVTEVNAAGSRTPQAWSEVSARESQLGGQLRVLADTAPDEASRAAVAAATSGLSGLVASRQAVDLRLAAAPPPEATELTQLDQRVAEAQRVMAEGLAGLRTAAGLAEPGS